MSPSNPPVRRRLKVTLLIDFREGTIATPPEIQDKLRAWLEGQPGIRVDQCIARWTTMGATRPVSK